MTWWNLISATGILAILAAAWLLSLERKRIDPRTICWGVGLQLILGFLVFVFPPGKQVFLLVNDAVVHVLSYAREGAEFVFGNLAIPPGEEGSMGFYFAFQALTAVIFFAAIVGLLYHVGIMPRVVAALARVFTRLMRVSGAEAVCLSSNIFVGIESALTVRPFLRRMTRSELCLVLTGGMATIASTVLAMYVLILRPHFPEIAGHLVSATVLSAPAALVMAKMLVPETDEPETFGRDVKPVQEKRHNWIEAVTSGSMDGFQLATGIAAVLIAFLGLLALVNGFTGWAGSWFGFPQLTLQAIAAYGFYPFVFLMGVPLADVPGVAELLGLRLFATEIPAYRDLAAALDADAISHRSAVIAAYSLCGFAHVASMGIFIGGIAALEPSRAKDLGAVGPRALLAATFACLMTGAVAGIFATDDLVLLEQALR